MAVLNRGGGAGANLVVWGWMRALLAPQERNNFVAMRLEAHVTLELFA